MLHKYIKLFKLNTLGTKYLMGTFILLVIFSEISWEKQDWLKEYALHMVENFLALKNGWAIWLRDLSFWGLQFWVLSAVIWPTMLMVLLAIMASSSKMSVLGEHKMSQSILFSQGFLEWLFLFSFVWEGWVSKQRVHKQKNWRAKTERAGKNWASKQKTERASKKLSERAKNKRAWKIHTQFLGPGEQARNIHATFLTPKNRNLVQVTWVSPSES